MNSNSAPEPDDPAEMDFYHFLHRPIKLSAGTFMVYACPHDDHPNCVILAGREFDPETDGATGVYYHANAGCVKRNVVTDRINWELAEPEATLSKVHGDDGTGRHFKVQQRMRATDD